MKYTEINVGLSINQSTGESWQKCDVKVSVEEGENPDEVFQQAKAKIDGWLPNPHTQITQKEELIDTRVGMVEAINACTSLDVLKTFSLLARANPEHKAAYDKKFGELSK